MRGEGREREKERLGEKREKERKQEREKERLGEKGGAIECLLCIYSWKYLFSSDKGNFLPPNVISFCYRGYNPDKGGTKKKKFLPPLIPLAKMAEEWRMNGGRKVISSYIGILHTE